MNLERTSSTFRNEPSMNSALHLHTLLISSLRFCFALFSGPSPSSLTLVLTPRTSHSLTFDPAHLLVLCFWCFPLGSCDSLQLQLSEPHPDPLLSLLLGLTSPFNRPARAHAFPSSPWITSSRLPHAHSRFCSHPEPHPNPFTSSIQFLLSSRALYLSQSHTSRSDCFVLSRSRSRAPHHSRALSRTLRLPPCSPFFSAQLTHLTSPSILAH